jgi:hypothetical protein
MVSKFGLRFLASACFGFGSGIFVDFAFKWYEGKIQVPTKMLLLRFFIPKIQKQILRPTPKRSVLTKKASIIHLAPNQPKTYRCLFLSHSHDYGRVEERSVFKINQLFGQLRRQYTVLAALRYLF